MTPLPQHGIAPGRYPHPARPSSPPGPNATRSTPSTAPRHQREQGIPSASASVRPGAGERPDPNRPASRPARPAPPRRVQRTGRIGSRRPARPRPPAGQAVDLPALPDRHPRAAAIPAVLAAGRCGALLRRDGTSPTNAPQSGSRPRRLRPPRARRRSPATSSPTWAPATCRRDQDHVHVLPARRRASTTTAPGSARSRPRVYGPDDTVIPNGWVHNLEHGALVVLYKGARRSTRPRCGPCSTPCRRAPSAASSQEGSRRARSSPGSTTWRGRSPRSSGVAYCRSRRSTSRPILDFYQTFGERTNPEELCPGARESAAPSGAASPSAVPSVGAVRGRASAAPSGSAAPAASPSAAPS